MMNKLLIKLLVFITVAGLLSIIVYILISQIPQPPSNDVKKAQIALSKAYKSKAHTFSKELYQEAKADYDSAMVNWRKQNTKFIYFRKYDKVSKFAKLSLKVSGKAIETSTSNSNSYQTKLKDKVASLEKLIGDINSYFDRYPLPREIRISISKGKMMYEEGLIEYKNGQLITATTKLNQADDLLSSVYDKAYTDLEQYLRSFPIWKKWTEMAINESKENQTYSIVVDKLSRKCFVYFNGAKKYEFDVELGRNWVGDKLRMGDKATPEGKYKIISKFSGTKYNNALLLDYPNEEDRKRFYKEKARGTIPSYAKIGGGIEIHGSGGKGVDWTEGCIALEDSEMNLIFRLASIGTPVTIVGSTKNINQIFTR